MDLATSHGFMICVSQLGDPSSVVLVPKRRQRATFVPPHLATYLGLYTHFLGTQRYLTLTPQILQKASQRF